MTAVDDHPSPSPSPTTSQRRPLFGFGEPKEPIQDGPLSSPLPSPTPSPEQLEEEFLGELAPDSADDWDGDPESGSPSRTGSPASTRVANPLNDDGLRDVFRGGVKIAGHQAHTYLANTPGKVQAGLYLADDEDASNIGDPLARIAGRHQGLGEVNPDTADLLAAMVGLTRYATRQLDRSRTAKVLDAGATPEDGPVDL